MSVSGSTKYTLEVALANYQAADELVAAIDANTAIASPLGVTSGGNGLVAKTGTGSSVARTITGTANQITVTNGDGVSGNPTLALPASIDITTSYKVNGTKVVGAQQTAVTPAAFTWSANTPSKYGTPTGSVAVADGSTPTVNELQNMICELRKNIVDLQAVLHTHGLTT